MEVEGKEGGMTDMQARAGGRNRGRVGLGRGGRGRGKGADRHAGKWRGQKQGGDRQTDKHAKPELLQSIP